MAVVHEESIYVIGGRSGVETRVVWLLGKLWVLGGKNDEGWRGKDLLVLLTNADSAKHWALVDPVTPFPGRYAGSGVVVRGRMCVMG